MKYSLSKDYFATFELDVEKKELDSIYENEKLSSVSPDGKTRVLNLNGAKIILATLQKEPGKMVIFFFCFVNRISSYQKTKEKV